MVAVLLVVVGSVSARPRPTALLPPRSYGKPEAATAVYKLLMMGMKTPETCWAVFKRQAINLRDWCIWLVDLFECMMMHGLTNPKYLLLVRNSICDGSDVKPNCAESAVRRGPVTPPTKPAKTICNIEGRVGCLVALPMQIAVLLGCDAVCSQARGPQVGSRPQCCCTTASCILTATQ